jgi:hypothetical protein
MNSQLRPCPHNYLRRERTENSTLRTLNLPPTTPAHGKVGDDWPHETMPIWKGSEGSLCKASAQPGLSHHLQAFLSSPFCIVLVQLDCGEAGGFPLDKAVLQH